MNAHRKACNSSAYRNAHRRACVHSQKDVAEVVRTGMHTQEPVAFTEEPTIVVHTGMHTEEPVIVVHTGMHTEKPVCIHRRMSQK